HKTPSTSGRPTAATSKRDARLLTSGDSSTAESTAPARVLLDRGPELIRPEVGPEAVGEDVLGVGGLPEEEVRDAALARGADHETRVGHLRLVQGRGKRGLVDAVGLGAGLEQPADGIDELGPAAVVERDPELKPRLVRRRALELVHLRAEPVGSAVASPDEAA